MIGNSVEEIPDVATERYNTQEQIYQLRSHQDGLLLRHVSQVMARNLTGHGDQPSPAPGCPLPSSSDRPACLQGYYFSFHASMKGEALYQSECVSSENPNWREFDAEAINKVHLRSLKGVLIRIWYQPEEGNAQCVSTWAVYFSGLVPIGLSLPNNHLCFEKNAIIFKLHRYYYTAPGSYHLENSENQNPYKALLKNGFDAPLSENKRSYTVSSLSRLHSTKLAHRQQQKRCKELQETLVHNGITHSSRSSHLAIEVDDCRVKVALLREQLETEIDSLRSLKLSNDCVDNLNQEKVTSIMGQYQDLHHELVRVGGAQQTTSKEAASLAESCDTLAKWRCRLISHLPIIYPIVQDGNGRYFICGVSLPDSESFEGGNEVMISVALGFVAHLLVMLAHLLHIPLRYPITPNGSMATVADTTSQQLRETDRQFPLFTRGKEREKLHFNYGVFLLNKDIAQLRWYCGLLTTDLRQTLANIHSLMAKLINHSGNGGNPADIMPDVLLPPLLPLSTAALELRTPNLLLGQQPPRSPCLSVKTAPVATNMYQPNIDDTDLQIEIAEKKSNLIEREMEPLSLKDSNSSIGKFVFIDKVQNPLVESGQYTHVFDDRLKQTNGFSFSLDNGLNKIGVAKNNYINNPTTGDDSVKVCRSVSNSLPGGSESNLIEPTVTEEDQTDGSSIYKDQTTELLRSWHEAMPSPYSRVNDSIEKLEEVGVECDESFMCKENCNRSPEFRDSCLHIQTNKINKQLIDLQEQRKASINANKNKENVSVSEKANVLHSPSDQYSVNKNDSVIVSNITCTENEKKEDKNESDKQSGEILDESNQSNENESNVSLSDFGISEDMFNDVAFRSAALANQKCSFKMSFSRQSTDEEFN